MLHRRQLCCTVLTTDRSEWLANVSKALRKLTSRWLGFGVDVFVPSEPPALLDKLTDELLVLSCDAVAAEVEVARRTETISGKAQTRLLAWVLSDARGAQARMDNALAETVGKRLQRQAQKVRDDTALAAAAAQHACASAELAAAQDASLRPGLAALLAGIEEEKQLALRKPREEVYIGFHELQSLLPPAELMLEPPEPPKPPAHSVLAAALQAARREEPEIPPIPPIPPELARALGSDGVQALWQCQQNWNHNLDKSNDWWRMLPSLVAHTLIDHSWQYHQGKEDGAVQIMDAMRKELALKEEADEDECASLLALKEQQIILLETRIAALERQLKLQARGEALPKAVGWRGIAFRLQEEASKRARHD